ncbi:MAG: hypothetical protein DVB28_001070 [Verrucomicrobia bacterium]|nr:MAG: hypothetical protein DVB28_001070 [Verrucomicrobiota bacterium]
MQKIDFAATIDLIIAEDPRFDRDAYFFIKDALEFTVEQTKKTRERGTNHVSGRQLLEGIREYALKYFGPMVPTVFETWGITACEHFGEMVYLLIQKGIFGKSEQDSLGDFKGVYTFHEAFVAPFQPTGGRNSGVASRGARVRRREIKAT